MERKAFRDKEVNERKATVGQTGQKALRRNGGRAKREKKASIMS